VWLLCVCVVTVCLCGYCVFVWLLCVCVVTVCLCGYCVFVWLLCVCVGTVCLCGYCVFVWLLCVCVVTVCFTRCKIKKKIPRSAHTVFMCFVWISEQTAINSLYNINWPVFITETESVYSAVRTGYLKAWFRLIVALISQIILSCGYTPVCVLGVLGFTSRLRA
jgi:hypothetical protein